MNRHKLIVVSIMMCIFPFILCKQSYGVKLKEKDVKVSIIVPVYNREEYLGICMDSLINQHLKEIEIICVDDGSTDNSGKILDKYAQEDDRVIVIHQEHKGVSAARNSGLDAMPKGEYITFVDSDDYIEEDIYTYAYNVAKEHDDDILEFGYRCFREGEECAEQQNIFTTSWEDKNITVDKNEINKDILIGNFFLWNKLYKAEMLEKGGNVRFVEGMLYEDNAYNLMVLPAVRRYERINKVFYNYRRTPESIVSKGRSNPGLQNCINAIPAVCNKWREEGLIKGNEGYLLDMILEKYFWILDDIASTDASYANKILEYFGDDIYNENVLIRSSQYVKCCLKNLETYRSKMTAV
ncbi:MAG: glycosyltransferase [Clostridiales bacterium]|nr:glycosyltransferase [Clostridiales bacterium]